MTTRMNSIRILSSFLLVRFSIVQAFHHTPSSRAFSSLASSSKLMTSNNNDWSGIQTIWHQESPIIPIEREQQYFQGRRIRHRKNNRSRSQDFPNGTNPPFQNGLCQESPIPIQRDQHNFQEKKMRLRNTKSSRQQDFLQGRRKSRREENNQSMPEEFPNGTNLSFQNALCQESPIPNQRDQHNFQSRKMRRRNILSSRLQDFLRGTTLPFQNGLCFKIILLESLLFSGAPRVISIFSSYQPTQRLFQKALFCNISKVGLMTTTGITSQMMVLFHLLCLPMLVSAVAMGLLLFQQSPAATIQKLTSIISGQKNLVMGIDNCIIGPFMEEVEFRFLLPLLLYWLVRRIYNIITGRREEEKVNFGPTMHKVVTAICSLLFAICHLRRYGGDVSSTLETLVGTFMTAQFLFVPAFEKHGLFAAWGAHASWNAVVARLSGLDLSILMTLF